MSSESALRDLLDTGELRLATVETVANGTVLRVDLDAVPARAAALRLMLDHVDVVDMVAGRYRTTDASLRLNVRGQIPSERTMVVISAPFIEARQIELIQDQIEKQRCRELVTRLAEIEQRY